jgi:hypothetical protein
VKVARIDDFEIITKPDALARIPPLEATHLDHLVDDACADALDAVVDSAFACSHVHELLGVFRGEG